MYVDALSDADDVSGLTVLLFRPEANTSRRQRLRVFYMRYLACLDLNHGRAS